jgi:hypothetical protein
MKQRTIYFLIALLFVAIALTSCTGQKNGCYSTKGMSGYR